MGRPREFDLDDALQAALRVFWTKGFEGASLSDLTEAMGITRPSLYAAYGNKQQLFVKALDRFQSTCLGFFEDALALPTAREVLRALLCSCADAYTETGEPPGSLKINGALVCSEASEPVRRELVRRRSEDQAALARRLDRARAEGDLPDTADPEALASFVMTVAQGMSVQAASGADRRALRAVAETALLALPH